MPKELGKNNARKTKLSRAERNGSVVHRKPCHKKFSMGAGKGGNYETEIEQLTYKGLNNSDLDFMKSKMRATSAQRKGVL